MTPKDFVVVLNDSNELEWTIRELVWTQAKGRAYNVLSDEPILI